MKSKEEILDDILYGRMSIKQGIEAYLVKIQIDTLELALIECNQIEHLDEMKAYLNQALTKLKSL